MYVRAVQKSKESNTVLGSTPAETQNYTSVILCRAGVVFVTGGDSKVSLQSETILIWTVKNNVVSSSAKTVNIRGV